MRSLLPTLAGAVALFAVGCAWMLEPIEQRFLFRPWSSDSSHLASVASRQNGIEEVRLKTPDRVTLHGWLKHPPAAPSGRRFPLVIVFGGVRRETSWMIDQGDKPERWGWLFINYRGYGLSGGEPSERVLLEDAGLNYDYAAATARRGPRKHRAARPEPGRVFRGGPGEDAPRPRRDTGHAFRQLRRSGGGALSLAAGSAAAQRALQCGWHRADHQGTGAVYPRRARRRHSDGARRGARSRVGRAEAHRNLGRRASLRDRAARRALERSGGVSRPDRV